VSLPLRAPKHDDVGYIIDTWRKSFLGGPGWSCALAVKGCDSEHYFTEMNRTIRGYLSRCDVRVAHNPNDPDHIVGYVCFSGREFHYGYIKKDFRGDVTVSDLLKDVDIDSYTFSCPYLEQLLLGLRGCRLEITQKNGREERHWLPPEGWRFTPRFSVP